MKLRRAKQFGMCLLDLYLDHHIPRAAAGLTYFLTLSFFPMLICLYNMLGTMFPAIAEIRDMFGNFLPRDAAEVILEFLRYVSENSDLTMLIMAVGVLITSASAAFRCVDNVSAEMRGIARYNGFFGVLFSIFFSLMFMVALYLAALLIVTGKWFLALLDRHIMFINISDSWSWMRFVLLFLLMFVMLSLIYRLTAPQRRVKQVRVLPGAIAASLAMLAVGIAFSHGIGVSVRYPIVYGSLASLILMMFWLYVCCIILFAGNAINIVLETWEGTNHYGSR